MRFPLLFVFGLLTGAYLPAQQTAFSGPVEAFTFDAPTRSLRAVIGVPGAASFGPALIDNLEFASVAPRQNYGIVFGGGKSLCVSGLNLKKISTIEMTGIAGYPDGVVWSGDGSLAVLYSRAGRWFQSITGFPSSPVAGQAVDVSSLGGEFITLAVDPSGQQIAVAVSGDKGAVYQASGGQFIPLVSMANPVSLSFSSNGQNLYALDAATGEVTATSLGGHGFQTFALPGIANPIAIESVQDSQSRQVLYVVGGSDRMLRILDVASQQIVMDVALNFQPTRLDPFGGGSFVLAPRGQSANPLWLFASTPQPGAYFVPAIQLRRVQHAVAGGAR